MCFVRMAKLLPKLLPVPLNYMPSQNPNWINLPDFIAQITINMFHSETNCLNFFLLHITSASTEYHFYPEAPSHLLSFTAGSPWPFQFDPNPACHITLSYIHWSSCMYHGVSHIYSNDVESSGWIAAVKFCCVAHSKAESHSHAQLVLVNRGKHCEVTASVSVWSRERSWNSVNGDSVKL